MASLRGWMIATCCLSLAAGLLAAPAARAQTDGERAQQDEIAELKRQLSVVVGELQELKTQMAVPETEELRSAYGLAPAASKVYGASRGLSIGGYAEASYRRQLGDAEGNGMDEANFERAVLYFGYKFSDRILFNTEIEIEDATTDDGIGEVALELAQLDFLIKPEFNVRAGLLLAPIGFLNEVHEPPFFYGTERPEPEQDIIPTTFRENGIGIFGNIGESFSYRAYVMNSFDAAGFSSEGLGDAKQDGAEAQANSMAFVGRVDFEPLDGLQVGGSFLQGNAGQDRRGFPSARTRLWELHTQYRNRGFHFRGLYTQASIGDASQLSMLNGSTVAERLVGGYAEVAYDLMQWLRPGSEQTLEPFFRFEYVDPQNKVPGAFQRDRTQSRRLFIPGIQFKPHPNVVLKLDYRNIDTFEGNAPDELRIGIGLAF